MAKHKKIKRAKSRKSYKLKLKKSTVFSISQIVFFSLAALVILSFSRKGSILIQLNDFLYSYLAWTTIFLPFIFLSFGFMLSKFRTPIARPNVIIGYLLFVLSVTTITRAGTLGLAAWEGIAGLVTSIGAFVILVGTTLVGLIVLFNTSLDQILGLVGSFLKQVRFYLLGEKKLAKQISPLGKKELKILGGNNQPNNPKPVPAVGAPLPMKPVTNLPGEKKLWKYPPLTLLTQTDGGHADRGDIKGNAHVIEQTLESFGITARVVEVNQGPAVTQYALEVALGTKLSKITALERDLARALASPTGQIRIEAPIPGRSLVGIEYQIGHLNLCHSKNL